MTVMSHALVRLWWRRIARYVVIAAVAFALDIDNIVPFTLSVQALCEIVIEGSTIKGRSVVVAMQNHTGGHAVIA